MKVILVILFIVVHSVCLLPILSMFDLTTKQLFVSCFLLGTIYTQFIWKHQELENKIFELKQLIESANKNKTE